jgi:thymidine phosphorylase
MPETPENHLPPLAARRLGIDTHQELVVYLREDSSVVHSEGFVPQSRVQVQNGHNTILATLNVVHGNLLGLGEAGLSEAAWKKLACEEGASVRFSHPRPVESLSDVRAKIYGHRISEEAFNGIIQDIVQGRYMDVHLAAFITACGGNNLSHREMTALTRAMVAAGDVMDWGRSLVVDKHCVGGLPGNRTTPIVVAIVTSYGLLMPKTSSRAITSPAGTADTMETLTNVTLSLEDMRRVVDQEGGCLAWGGAARLSPADDVLIRVERTLNPMYSLIFQSAPPPRCAANPPR